MMDASASALAARLIARLTADSQRLVCAESCTGGALAAALTAVAGASEVFCGSAVTYRESAKTQWLGVAPATLRQHTAVSGPVATEMALGVLARTEEARFSASLTGHFGPGAPPDQDGVVFIGLALRDASGLRMWEAVRLRLEATDRASRRTETVARALEAILRLVESRGQVTQSHGPTP